MTVTALPDFTRPHGPDIHIWQLYLPRASTYYPQWSTWLSADECDRAHRFQSPQDRQRFTLCRGGLRYLLAQYLSCPPGAIRFNYGPHGKPELYYPQEALQFNVAHSGDWAIYGIGHLPCLGVDVEQVIPRVYLDRLIQRCLTPNEQAYLPSLSADRLRGFVHYWTLKEAHLKALGIGLSYPMQDIEVAWLPQLSLVRPAAIAPRSPAEWTLKLWQPAADAIAAVCVEQPHSYFTIQSFPIP